MKGRRPA